MHLFIYIIFQVQFPLKFPLRGRLPTLSICKLADIIFRNLIGIDIYAVNQLVGTHSKYR